MIAKFFVLTLSCIFIGQIHHVQCQESKITSAPSQPEFANATANKTINTLLRHLRIDLTNPVSASVVRYIVTAVRTVLTDETGQKNIKNVADFLVDTLENPNTLILLKIFHRRLVQLAAAGKNSPLVLETAAGSTRKILDEPQVLAATEGLIEGINCVLEDMNAQKLRDGIGRVIKLQKMASLFNPNKVADKVQTGLKKLRKSNSDGQINYQSVEGGREIQLQTRALSGNNAYNGYNGYDDEHGWINKEPKVDINSKKGGSDKGGSEI